MNSSRPGLKALTAAAFLIAVRLTREAGGGRRLATALEPVHPAQMGTRALLRRSSELSRHLTKNPNDVLAAELLNDVDTEIIGRS